MMSDQDIVEKTNNSVNVMNSNNYKNLVERGIKLGKTVLNLDNKGSGTHWVGIKPACCAKQPPYGIKAESAAHVDKGKKEVKILDYHDSFGVIPPFHIKNTIIKYNPYVEQKNNEVNCGERAINFLRKN